MLDLGQDPRVSQLPDGGLELDSCYLDVGVELDHVLEHATLGPEDPLGDAVELGVLVFQVLIFRPEVEIIEPLVWQQEAYHCRIVAQHFLVALLVG